MIFKEAGKKIVSLFIIKIILKKYYMIRSDSIKKEKETNIAFN